MGARTGERCMVVERLPKGRAVVLTADGVFRETKLPQRLVRRGEGAIGHVLGREVADPAGLRRARSIPGKGVGWAATAAVCLGILLGTPVRGWIDPFTRFEGAGSAEYRLTATLGDGESVWEGGSVHVDLSTTSYRREVNHVGQGYVLSPRRATRSVHPRVHGEPSAESPVDARQDGTLDFSPVRAVGWTTGGANVRGPQSRPASRQTSRGRQIHAGR